MAKATTRRLSDDEKRRILAQFETRPETESVGDFIRRMGLNFSTFYNWRSSLKPDPKVVFKLRQGVNGKHANGRASAAERLADERTVGLPRDMYENLRLVAAFTNSTVDALVAKIVGSALDNEGGMLAAARRLALSFSKTEFKSAI